MDHPSSFRTLTPEQLTSLPSIDFWYSPPSDPTLRSRLQGWYAAADSDQAGCHWWNETPCSNTAPILELQPVTTTKGSSTTIQALDWQAIDPEQSATQLIYTLTVPPENGRLQLNGVTLQVSDRFTQDDINRDRLSYFSQPSFLQLTNDTANDGNTQILGQQVVWAKLKDGDTDVWLYDGVTARAITDNRLDDFAPQVFGNYVVWNGFDGNDTEIFLYDGASIRQITNNTVDDDLPTLSNFNQSNYTIVWQASDGQDLEIFVYDGSQVYQLTNNRTDDYNPVVSDALIVWTGFAGRDTEIFTFDGVAIRQLTDNAIDDYYPLISGRNITWTAFDGTDSEVFYFNGQEILQLTNNQFDDAASSIFGQNVVWSGFDGNDDEVFWYNGDSLQDGSDRVRQLTDNRTDDTAPQVSGAALFPHPASINIVWHGFDGNDTEIFYYNGDRTRPLTNNSKDDLFPQISGFNVIWRSLNGGTSDISYANLSDRDRVGFQLSDGANGLANGTFSLFFR
jgi:hypothetical protein